MFAQAKLVPRVESGWGRIMGVMHELLNASLQDPLVQKVMLLSGDSVPLKSFSSMYESLMARPASSLCLCQKRFWGTENLGPEEYMAAKAHTWFILNRVDAALVVGRRKLWMDWGIDKKHRVMQFRGGDDEYVIMRQVYHSR